MASSIVLVMSYVHCLTVNDGVFTDIDECTNSSACGQNQLCVDTIGSFMCNCIEGFTLTQDGDDCEGNGLSGPSKTVS